MVVYIDTFLIINFCMNFLIIKVTKTIVKSKVSVFRLFISSLISTIYSMTMFISSIPILAYISMCIAFSVILIKFTYRPSGKSDFFRVISVFYIVCFSTGGCSYVIINITKSETLFWVLTASAVFTYIVVSAISNIYERYFKIDQLSHDLVIIHNNNSVKIECYFDTGNNLTDPISKLPVIIVNFSSICNLFPKEITEKFLLAKTSHELLSCTQNKFKLKLVPFTSIGGDGILVGFNPDRLILDHKEINAIVCIIKKDMFSDKKTDAILNPILLI